MTSSSLEDTPCCLPRWSHACGRCWHSISHCEPFSCIRPLPDWRSTSRSCSGKGRVRPPRPGAPTSQPCFEACSVQLPMSAAQSRFWRHEVLSERPGANNSLATLELTGYLDVGRFVAALRSLVSRHEILRTRFEVRAGQAVQVIEQAPAIRVSMVDYSNVADTETILGPLRRGSLTRPYDLAAPPLFECVLLRVRPRVHVLVFVIHHIISDGWAQHLLIEEWVTTYLQGRPPD